MPAILKVLSFALTCKSQSKQIMSVLRPFNFQKWLDENRDLLKPPVANKNLTPDSDEYIVMVVAGPNARKDYHYNETEEFFYQLEGNITVNVQIDGKVESLNLGPGDMMTVPAKVPHSPVRHEGSIGLVIERVREGKALQMASCGIVGIVTINFTTLILN